ncbi:DUF748 domain-containing protein [Ferrimonas balearica]|uniref:DUF748 domain-containing protein n=1 Tax=Ferrimonas balearica TaxID=44012 RepID=UPI001C9984C6|nr:DUF748 domain-containing protein [Ferrimonas balearica]MBY5991272.1 DUF748 domain-containing protein [Ferrimonas balearica]
MAVDWAKWWQRRWVRYGSYGLLAFALYLLVLGVAVPRLVQSQAPKWVAENLAGTLEIGEVRLHPLTWDLQIDALSLKGEDGAELAGFDALDANLEPMRSLFGRRWQLNWLYLEHPRAHLVELATDETNWSRLLAPLAQDPEPAPEEAPARPLPAFAVDDLALSGGRIHYQRDASHGTELSDISLKAQDFHLSRGENQVHLTVTGPGGGRGELDLAANFAPLDLALELEVTNADLTRYWPYFANDFHFTLPQARLDLSVAGRISLDEDLQITVHDGAATMKELALAHEQETFLTLGQLALTGVDLDFAQRQVTLDDLTLSALELAMNRDEAGVDLAQILAPKTTAEGPAPTQEPDSAPWSVRLASLSLEESRVSLADQTLAEPATWSLALVPLVVGPLGTDFDEPIVVDLDGMLNDTTTVNVDGQWLLAQQEGAFELNLEAFDLLATKPYWQPYLDLLMLSGRLSTSGELNLALGEPMQLTYGGRLGVAELVTQDTVAQRDFVKWGQLDVNRLDFDLAGRRLAIDNLAFHEPYARVIIEEDGGTNFAQLIPSAPESPQGVPAEPTPESTPSDSPASEVEVSDSEAPPFEVEIKRVLFTEGAAFFADNTLTPRFATGIEAMTGEISGLSSQTDSRARVDIAGQVDRYAPVSLTGEIQPLSEEHYLDLALTFDNVELTSLNPYSGTYAGYFIDQGQLDLALNYALDGNQLKGSNQVVISQLKLGQRSDSKKATTLPVALAVALLEDSNGVIDLGLEVSGNLDDPEFAIGPLIFKALGNAITKIVTAPFALLGNLLGGEEPPDSVAFKAGQSEVDGAHRQQLERLVEGLNQRPALVISVQGAVDPQEDGRALAKERLDARLLPPGSGLTEPPPEVLAAAYDARQGAGQAQQERQDLAARLPDLAPEELERRWQKGLYEQLLDAEPVDELALKTLALARGEAVKSTLVDAGLDPNRVFLRESRINLDTSGAKVVMELDASG